MIVDAFAIVLYDSVSSNVSQFSVREIRFRYFSIARIPNVMLKK